MIVNTDNRIVSVGQDLIKTLLNHFVRIEFSDGRNVEGVAVSVVSDTTKQNLISIGGWVTLSRNENMYLSIDSVSILSGSLGFVEVWTKENHKLEVKTSDPKLSEDYIYLRDSEELWQCGDCMAFWPFTIGHCPNEDIDSLIVSMKHLLSHLDNPMVPCMAIPEKRPCAYERVYRYAVDNVKKNIDMNNQNLFTNTWSIDNVGH